MLVFADLSAGADGGAASGGPALTPLLPRGPEPGIGAGGGGAGRTEGPLAGVVFDGFAAESLLIALSALGVAGLLIAVRSAESPALVSVWALPLAAGLSRGISASGSAPIGVCVNGVSASVSAPGVW